MKRFRICGFGVIGRSVFFILIVLFISVSCGSSVTTGTTAEAISDTMSASAGARLNLANAERSPILAVKLAFPSRPCDQGDLVDCALAAYEVSFAPNEEVNINLGLLLGRADRDDTIVDAHYGLETGLVWKAVADGHLDGGRTERAEFWINKMKEMEIPERPGSEQLRDLWALRLGEATVHLFSVREAKEKGIPSGQVEFVEYLLTLAQQQLQNRDEQRLSETLREIRSGLNATMTPADRQRLERQVAEMLLTRSRIDSAFETLPASDDADRVRNRALLAKMLMDRGDRNEAEKQIAMLLSFYNHKDSTGTSFHKDTDGAATQSIAEVRGAASARDFVNRLDEKNRLSALARAACALSFKEASELFSEVNEKVDLSKKRNWEDLLEIAHAARLGGCRDQTRHYLEKMEQVLEQTPRADAGLRKAAEEWAMIGDFARARRFLDQFFAEDMFHDEVLISNVIDPAAFQGSFEAAVRESIGIRQRSQFASAVIHIALAAQKLKKELTPNELELLRQAMEETLGTHRLYTALNKLVKDTYVALDTDEPFENDEAAERIRIPVYLEQTKLALAYTAERERSSLGLFGGAEGLAENQRKKAALQKACARHGITLVEVDGTWDGSPETLADLLKNKTAFKATSTRHDF